MNLVDMQLLIASVEKVNAEIKLRGQELDYASSVRELKHVQLSALSNYKERLLNDFEIRHEVEIDR